MIKKAQRQEMQDYLVSRLDGAGHKIESRTREIIPGIKSSYILVGDEGIVLLVDKPHSKKDFIQLYRRAKQHKRDVAVVLFKDGQTFFRSAQYRGYQKRKSDRSLKTYRKQDMQKLLMLRPEEIFLANNRTYMQYYQPQSVRLEQALECFNFKPVRFDYSHIDETARFKPEDETSKRLFIWKYRGHITNDLVLDGDYLKDRTVVTE